MNTGAISEWVSKILSSFETERIRETIINMDERSFLILGVSTIVLVVLCVLKRMIRTATLILALCAITVLLHYTMPEEGQEMALSQIVQLFVGGAFIVATSIYFIFIRSD
jgi:hypothetical protein